MDSLSISQTTSKALLLMENFSEEQIVKICRMFLQNLILGNALSIAGI